MIFKTAIFIGIILILLFGLRWFGIVENEKQKRPHLRKHSFRGRELCSLRDTTPNLSAPHNTNLICCGQENDLPRA
jgi:hypothetical protein